MTARLARTHLDNCTREDLLKRALQIPVLGVCTDSHVSSKKAVSQLGNRVLFGNILGKRHFLHIPRRLRPVFGPVSRRLGDKSGDKGILEQQGFLRGT